MMHVADGVDVNQETDPRHHHQHDDGKRIELERDVGADAARAEPLIDDIQVPLAVMVLAYVLEDGDGAENRGAEGGGQGDGGDEPLAGAFAEQAVQQKAGERRNGDEPEGVEHGYGRTRNIEHGTRNQSARPFRVPCSVFRVQVLLTSFPMRGDRPASN
jgi:hypothetical protein